MAVTIHPTAIVDPGAKLADNVVVGPYAVIEANVEIDEDTKIHHHAFIAFGARIGKRCTVHHAAVVANVPQDLKFKGTEDTYAIIGDDTTIREFATIHRATVHTSDTNAGTQDGTTRVGSGCLIMAYSHVAHDCFIGDSVILSNAVQMAGHVTIERGATIGGGALIHQFCLVGEYTMVGGGAQVRKDVPPYALTGGGDARYSGINRIGLQRRGKSPETIDAIKSAFALLYHSGRNVTDATLEIASSPIASIPEIQHLLEFISLSKRGIIAAA
jgi:UDP-N-acetylglucosamine acyltransferase